LKKRNREKGRDTEGGVGRDTVTLKGGPLLASGRKHLSTFGEEDNIKRPLPLGSGSIRKERISSFTRGAPFRGGGRIPLDGRKKIKEKKKRR